MSSKPIPSLILLCALLASALPAIAKDVPAIKPASQAYKKRIADKIGPIWYRAVKANETRVGIGTVKTTFRIMPDGRVENLRIISNTSNRVLADASIRAIKAAKLPPVPTDVLKEQAHNWIEADFSFKMFPN